MASEKGNQYAKKLTTPELKAEAYRQYLVHIADGWPKEAWWFEHPDLTLTWETMETYIKNEPEVFSPVLMKIARSKRFKHWFSEGSTLMKGGYEHGSPVVWQTIMRNMFKEQKWDQQDLQTQEGPTESIKVFIQGVDNAADYLLAKTASEHKASDSKD